MAEIAMMQSLLDLAEKRGMDVAFHGLHGDPPMEGMLSSAEMAALEGAEGEEFVRLWLEGMIMHHEGAVDMARTQQRQQRESNRRPFQLDVLADDILLEQRTEVGRMREWLESWFGE